MGKPAVVDVPVEIAPAQPDVEEPIAATLANEFTEATTDILIECAYFDPERIAVRYGTTAEALPSTVPVRPSSETAP